MIIQFLKNTAKSYFSQVIVAFIYSFFVFAYVGNYGFTNLLYTISQFITTGGSFFYNLLTHSTYDYLYQLPFIVPPFYVFWVLGKKYFFKYKVQQINKYTNAHLVHDAIEGVFSSISFTMTNMILVKLASNGYGALYENINDYPIYYIVLSMTAIVLAQDAWFYWLHRAMHHKHIYKYIHKSHHVSIDTTPLTQNAFNFVEMLFLPIGGLIPIFFIPTYAPAFTIYLLVAGVLNLVAHLGYEFFPRWMLSWKTTSTHHNMHHQYFDGNYGTYFTFWDKICKTEFKDYEERFLEIKTRVALKK